jgi:Tol biopolymer transport system component
VRPAVCLVLLLQIAACVRPAESFTCASSSQCTEGGVCQPVGFCSFGDTTCPSGQRYGAASGSFGGTCVGDEPDAGTGSGEGCDLTKPFGTAILVPGLASAAEDASMRLSPDEKTAYFFSARSGTKLLYTASRASPTAAFGNVTVLANVNTGNQYNPSITADGLTLFFASFRSGGVGDNDIYQATRGTTSAGFTNTRLAPNVNTTASEVQPYVTHDGTAMYFVRALATGATVFRAAGSVTAGFTNAAVVAEVDGATNDSDPVPSADGLTLYWASDRPGGQGDLDVWEMHRAGPSGVNVAVAPVTSVNAAGLDAPSDVSADGCRLYLTSTRNGRTGIYVATRPR